jgi:hypothetical protein
MTNRVNVSQKGNLNDTFNDQGLSDYIVVFLRLLTSMHLKKEAEFYQNFMEGDMTVANFCRYLNIFFAFNIERDGSCTIL